MSAGLPAIRNAQYQASTSQAIYVATGNGKGLTNANSALSAEYLCSTVFSSLAAFTHYMRFNDYLQVPANQTLTVKDIRLLTDNVSEKPLPTKNRVDYHLSILRRAVAPLARSCRVVLPTGEDVRVSDFVSKTEDDFTLRPVRDLEVVLTETPIDMRLSDLYRMMLLCSIPHVSFDPWQKLTIWGRPDNQCVYDPCPNIRTHVDDLFRNTHALSGVNPSATWSRLDVTPVELGSARGMEMKGTRMTIFLNDYYRLTSQAIYAATGDGKGLTNANSTLSAEYLCSTEFSSLAAFTHYMRFNDRLQIPANRILIIKDIRLLTDNVSEKPLPINKNLADYHLSILRRAVAPLARSCRVVLPTGEDVDLGDFVSKAGDDFTLWAADDLEIVLTETPIDMRLSDLYRMMLVCSIPHVSFHSWQKLIIWGGPDNQCVDNPCPNICAHVDDLFRNTYALSGVKAFATWLRLDVTPVEFGPARGMQMTGTRMTIFLNDYYSFDIEELRERMAVVGEINVPPNQTLMIKDPLLLKFVAMYEEGAELGDLGLYVSDQFTLFLNRWIVPSGFTSQFFAEEGMLTLYHSDGFRLQLSPDSSAVTNLFDIDVYFDELNKRNKLNELNAQKLVEEFTTHILSL